MADDEPGRRMQFAFWVEYDLGARFRSYCERAGRFQREVMEELIEALLESKQPRAGAPAAAAVSSTFPAPAQVRGSDSCDGDK